MKVLHPATFIILSLFLLACSGDDAEQVIDCLFAEADFDVRHTIDNQDPNAVPFTVTYSGDHNLDNSMQWDFGDGTSEAINGTTAQHTYSSPGTYEVKVKPTIREGNAFCTPELKETVVIN